MSDQGVFEGMDDGVPEEVQDAADRYYKAQQAATRARSKKNAAQDLLIELAKEHDVTKVRVANGEKVIDITTADKIAIKKASKLRPDEFDDDDDDE